MSSSDKIPPVLGSPSATDTKGVAAEVTVAATAAEATEASAPGAVVADVAAAGGVVDGAAPADEETQLLAEVAAAEAKVTAAKVVAAKAVWMYYGTSVWCGRTTVQVCCGGFDELSISFHFPYDL